MKRQANVLSALIQNFDTAESAIKASSGSAGSALRENEVFLDSFEGRLQQLTNAVQTKWHEALDTDTIKDAIQLLTKLVNTLDFEDSALVDIIGDLIKGLSWLMDVFGDGNFAYTLIAFFSARSINKNGWLDFFNKFKKEGTETIEGLENRIGHLNNRIAHRQKGLRKQGFTEEQFKSDLKIQQWNKEIEESKEKITQYNEKVKETDESLNKVNATTTQSSAVTTANSGTTTANTVATGTNAGAQNTNTVAQTSNTAARQQAGLSTDAHTQDVNENTIATETNTNAQNKNAVAVQKNTGGFKNWAKGVGSSLKSLGKTIVMMAAIQGAMEMIDSISSLIKDARNKKKGKTFEELHEEFEKSLSDLQEEKSELSNIESELDDINSQIKEIQSLGSLSFTKEEELKNLQKQREELERQAEIQEIIAKNQQKKTNTAALNAAKSYLQQSAETDESVEEYVQNSTKKAKKWGKLIGGALKVVGGVVAVATSWTGVGAAVGAGLMAAGYAVDKGTEHISEAVARKKYEKQQTHQQAINNYKTKREDYQKRLNEAYSKGNVDEYDKIKKEYENFEVMMSDNIGGLMEYLNSVDYKTLTDIEKADYEAYNRMVNQYSIANGGSVTNAIDSILDYDRYERTGYELDQIQEAFKDGEISSEEAEKQIRDLLKSTSGLESEFTALGIDIDDVVASYIQLGEAAKENMSLTDSLDKISGVTKAFDELGDAVKEFREEGRVSVDTLESLNEKFGDIDGFEELYKVLATGEGDLESAVTNVANAYVGQVQALSDLTDEELDIMVSRLKALGVLNAEEVLMARQKGQAQLDALGLAYSIDLSNYGTAEQAKLAIAQAAGLKISDITESNMKALAEQYGVDLENYATTEEAKIAIAQARAKAEAETDRANLNKDYKNGKITYAEYQDRLEDINNSLNFSDTYSTIQGILNSAYQDFTFDFDNQIGIGSEFDEHWGEDEASKAFQEAMDYWENRISANQAKYDQIQNEINLLESKGMRAGEEYYRKQIELENERKTLLENQKAEALAYLATLKEGSEQWWEVANTINDIEGELDDVTASVQELSDAIGQIRWDTFEKVHERFSNLITDLENIRDILSNEDMFDDEGNFTKEGVANLATYIQELEIYENALTGVQEELEDFQQGYEGNEDYFASIGIDSEQEYYDKLVELTDEQDEYTKKIKESEQSVIEVYENQIEAVEEYINELIDGYNDYIDTVKEALDAERDLYDFKKNVQKQTKDISSLERRIAALSGSTNAADIAERRKLQAELNEAKEGLNDTYYDHAKEQQAQALDDEAKAYEESMNKYVESLREMLEEATKDMTTFLSSVTNVVVQNAGSVEDAYNNTGLAIDSAIITPWTEAKEVMDGFEENALSRMNDWTKAGENGYFYNFDVNATNQLESPWSAGTTAANAFASSVKTVMGEVYNSVQSNVDNSLSKLNSLDDGIQTTNLKADDAGEKNKTPSTNKGSSTTYSKQVEDLQKIMNFFFDANIDEDGKFGPGTRTAVKNMQKKLGVSNNGVYNQQTYTALMKYLNKMNVSSWFRATGVSIPGAMPQYAKGTLDTLSDELAIVDELGPELIMHADPVTGRLQYLTKGSSVVPSDLSANLVEWGKLNPDMLKVGGGANINMISNAVSKPELNLSFEALVKAEKITEDTLPEVKKFVKQEIDSLVKQMNYAIKKFK